MLTPLVTGASLYSFSASPAASHSSQSTQGGAVPSAALAPRSGMPLQAEHWLGYLPNVSAHFGVRHRRVKDVEGTSGKPQAPVKKKITVDLEALRQTAEGKKLISLARQLRELEPKETDESITSDEQTRLLGVRSDIDSLAPEDRRKITPIIQALDAQEQSKAQHQRASSPKSRSTPVEGTGRDQRMVRKKKKNGHIGA